MINRVWRRLRRFFRKSSTVNNEPINQASLLVIILIDVFILVNVFIGLNDIGYWYMSPAQAYECYSEWQQYRTSEADQKESDTILNALQLSQGSDGSLLERYQRYNADHLGSVAAICLDYADAKDRLATNETIAAAEQLEQHQDAIDELNAANQTIREQYDSTLLENLAGQPREQSINAVEAAQARQELDANTRQIDTLKAEQAALREQLVTSAVGDRFLQLLADDHSFQQLEQQRDRALFWYPSIQIVFQGLFLIPLIALATGVHRYSQRRGYGLIALISWHLTVIVCLPLIVKVFEFLQVGVLFEVLSRVIRQFLGGLLFLINYLYILLIPLLGFGIIKFFQRVILNPRVQAASRVQQGRCIRCAKKIRQTDTHCPHCGYYQFVECPHCHAPTYQHLSYCRECGVSQLQE